MVICEDPQPEIDLKCKDKLTDSDNEGQDEDLENKNFTQSRYSPVSGQKHEVQDAKLDITCRPKPIKGESQPSSSSSLRSTSFPMKFLTPRYVSARLPSTGIETVTKYHTSMEKGGPVSVLSTYPYLSPVNPTGVSGFQPKGGAFITMPVSPKVVKPEPAKNEQQYSTQYSVSNLVANIHNENGRTTIQKFPASPVVSHTVSTRLIFCLSSSHDLRCEFTMRLSL